MSTIARRVVITLLVAHGLFHLSGIAKAFGWAEVEELKEPISEWMGVAWLAAAVLLFAAAASLAFGIGRWWAVGAAGALMSQAVMVASWSDTEAGTFVNAALVLAIIYDFMIEHAHTTHHDLASANVSGPPTLNA